MIRMTAEIELLQGSGEINTESITISPSGNNISADVADVVGFRKAGSNPFLIGISRLDSGATYSGGEGYFIGSYASDAEGNFINPKYYTLTFEIEDIDSQEKTLNFSIIFDTYYNAYPKRIQCLVTRVPKEGTSYTKSYPTQENNSSIFTFYDEDYNGNIPLDVEKVIVSVRMYGWSMPNYPLRIQGIYTGIKLYIDRRNMLSLSAPIKDRSDNEQPSYGIISNSGSLSLIDSTGEIKEYARMKLLKPDLDVQLTLEDTLTKKTQSIGKFKTYTWTYNNKNFEVDIELKDDLERIQELKSSKMPLQASSMNLFEIYTWIINKINEQTLDFTFIIDNATQTLLLNIECEYPYLENGNYWEQLTKLCNIAGIHVYENANKEIVVHSDFGG